MPATACCWRFCIGWELLPMFQAGPKPTATSGSIHLRHASSCFMLCMVNDLTQHAAPVLHVCWDWLWSLPARLAEIPLAA